MIEDAEFRDFIADLFAVSAAMQSVRRALGKRLGLRGNELAVMLAVARLGPVGIRAVAEHLHVAAPNITAEVQALVGRGLLEKRASKADSRAVTLAHSPAGQALMAALQPVLAEVNGALFGHLSRPAAVEMRRVFAGLLAGTPAALAVLEDQPRR